ncbi:MAG TPA: PAS domain S-box protein [Candidatus Binatia bacterium]
MNSIPAPLDEEMFRRMADMSTEAFYVTDFQGRFRYVNQRALDLTGYTWKELQGMTTAEIDPDYPLELYQQAVSALEGPMPVIETRSRRKDGTFFPVEVSAALLQVGGERYVFGVVRDISARKQSELARQNFAQRLLQTLEAERQRVARELHDDVGQALATVGGLLRSLERVSAALPAAARPALDATLTTIRDITASVGRIVRDYHPAGLSDAGLADTIRQHAQQFAECHALRLEVVADTVSGLLDRASELHLYRIAQEALANVARHARATRVRVRLCRQCDGVVLDVRDDGVGIGADRTATGLGLVTMRERAALMHARFTIRPLPRHGTEVRVVVPCGVRRGGAPGARATARSRRRVVPAHRSR